MRRLLLLAALGLLSTLLTPSPGAAQITDDRPTPPSPRNAVVIVVDDLPWHMMEYLPKTRALLLDSGLEFDNHIVSTSTCCPARASIFTGLQPNNHGVINNTPPFGGSTRFDHEQTFVASLHDAGYRTGLFGKYINRFGSIQPYTPPGWDTHNALTFPSSPTKGFFDYKIIEDGTSVSYGTDPEEYSTTVLRDMTLDFIDTHAGTAPFFAYFAPFAPHKPATAEPQYEGLYQDIEVPLPPNFNEADVSDKPRLVADSPPLTAAEEAEMEQLYKDMAETLPSIDDAVEDIVLKLKEKRVLGRTLIVFVSDNGLSLGSHRIERKECAYEECIRSPLLIRKPNARFTGASDELVTIADIAPTVLNWLKVDPEWEMDGANLNRFFQWPNWTERDEVLIQVHGRAFNQNANFIGLRTKTEMYAFYRNGQEEYYDLTVDPYQLDNAVDDPSYAARVDELRAALEARKEPTDLSVAAEASTLTVGDGDRVTIDIEVTNNGSVMATNVFLALDTPGKFRQVGCSGSDSAACYTFGSDRELRYMVIDPGQTVTGTFEIEVRAGVSPGISRFNGTLDLFNVVDPDTSDNTVRIEFTVE
ncbi:MAG: sulfatase-like hydrolase/transferase [Actinomycetota bacterium]